MPATKKKTTKEKADVKTTRIGFVIDESGSMQGTQKSVTDGYNEFVATLLKEAPDAKQVFGTLGFFDTHGNEPSLRIKRDNVAFNEMPELAVTDYNPRGRTPLNDAISGMLGLLGKASDEGDQVMLVIVTDGHENSSELSGDGLRKLVQKAEADGVEFVYLGANVDSFTEARNIGLSGKAGQFANFSASPVGTANTMRAAGQSASVYTTSGSAGMDAVATASGTIVPEDPEEAKRREDEIKAAHEKYMAEQKEKRDQAEQETKAAARDAASGVFKRE